MTPPLLATRGLTKHYGGVVAVDAVSVDVASGSITGVIGPNGAGKSTLVGLLGGALTPSAGSIAFDGADITRRRAADRARLGIGRTYQIPRPFLDMTVEDNLALAQAADRPLPAGTSAAARRTEILKKTGLEDVAMVPARNLPLLRRKRLEVARALALEPRLLLLDEVGAGLIDSEVTELIALIRDVAVEGVTILIVEHVLRIVRECCSSLLVLNFGKVLATGTPGAVLGSDEVAAVYLGTARDRRTLPTESVSGAAPVDGPSVGRLNLHPLIGPTSQVSAASPMLEVRAVTAAHGQAVVLRDVSLKLGTGEVVAVLGANGAGKTSLAQVITGALRPRTGSVHLAGEAMEGARPDQFATRGVAHCMEGRRIFTDLTVEQNLRIGARATTSTDAEARLEAVYRLFEALHECRARPGTSISGGQQQMLAIGRALMARPRLVIFDEISLGLAPIAIDRLYAALALLKRAGMTMLIIEQDVDRALELADRAYVLEHGAVALEGPAAKIRSDPLLTHLYVGTAD